MSWVNMLYIRYGGKKNVCCYISAMVKIGGEKPTRNIFLTFQERIRNMISMPANFFSGRSGAKFRLCFREGGSESRGNFSSSRLGCGKYSTSAKVSRKVPTENRNTFSHCLQPLAKTIYSFG